MSKGFLLTRCSCLLIVGAILFGLEGCDGDSTTQNTNATGSQIPSNATRGSRAATATIDITGSPSTSVVAGSSYSFQPLLNDTNRRVPIFSIHNSPSWASFNTSTGQLSGAPTQSDVATYSNIVISASAGAATSTLAPFAISVTPAKQSISKWVSCTGTADDTQGLMSAFDAAKHGAFTLVVDCPVRLQIGTDIARTIFIDDGTTVEFNGAGKFIVNNVFLPAFVIANSKDIILTNWNVEYDASLPVDSNTAGYYNSGEFVAAPGYAQPAFAFNDKRLSPWLSANRGITFDRGEAVNAVWIGPTNSSSVFYITGDTSNVTITGMHISVPTTAGGDRFVPMAFSLSRNYKSKQTITAATPATAQFMAVPHDLVFSDIDLDGTYMGWQGNARNVAFEHIRSHRYGDLQNAQGGDVGGIGKWFAPPHLFYLNYDLSGDPALFNQNIRIHDVIDDGPRVGVARDKGGSDTVTGYALSLKIGCVECVVDTYETMRPDGFLDVLPSSELTISNVKAIYNSGFLNNLFAGWRFPSAPYTGVTFKNIFLQDLASTTVIAPISSTVEPSNSRLTFQNVRVTINRWAGQGSLLPTIAGQGNNIALNYLIQDSNSQLIGSTNGSASMNLQVTPITSRTGEAVELKWSGTEVTSCAATGAFSGALGTAQSRAVTMTPGTYGLSINCQNADYNTSAAVNFVVQP